jgi:hypothetical protein
MIHLRFITLFVMINCFLGTHTFSISNRTNHPERSLTSAALNADGEHIPSAIRPHGPRAGMSRNVARVVGEKMLVHPRDSSPTPAPDGPSQDSTTVHITDPSNFAILLPRQGSGGKIHARYRASIPRNSPFCPLSFYWGLGRRRDLLLFWKQRL